MFFSPGPRVIGRTKFENWFLIWFVLWKRWSAEVFSLSFFLEEEDPEDVCDSAENDSKGLFQVTNFKAGNEGRRGNHNF